MPRAFRNSMNSGVLDPLLYARADLEQWRTGLKTGTNVLLLPQGGVRRRPGTKYVATLTEATARLSRFRFNVSAQYLLVWSNLKVEVYQSDVKLTQVVTPYVSADLSGLYRRCQTADTAVVFHEDYAPMRLLRGTLASGPIYTTSGSAVVKVKHPAHQLLDNDTIGIAGVSGAVGGIAAANLNTSHTISLIDGTLGATATATTSSSTTVRVSIASHGFAISDRVELESMAAVGGIPANELNKVHTITAISAGVWVEFVVETAATSTTTGGGAGTWSAPDFYNITVSGGNASSTTSGGGAACYAWVFHSLAVNASRDVAFTNLPQFDFEDASSPKPKSEVQRLTFLNFATGDKYSLSVGLPRFDARDTSGSDAQSQLRLKTIALTYDEGDRASNASQMEEEIANLSADNPGQVTVEFDSANSSSNHDEYVFRFTGSQDVEDIEPRVVKSTSGTITAETDVEGGSTEEDVISTTRGWPASGLFYQRRLWMTALRSRSATIIASKTEDFFNFDVGEALDSEAIDATGEFDPARFLIAERGLYLLTHAGEVTISGGNQGGGLTPTNINLEVAARYGSTTVAPVSVGGRPMYVDRIARNIRQLGTDEMGAPASQEVSILSQHLISSPVSMDVWRSADGDYLFVVNDDGTIAALSINVDQGVAGWTKITTDGSFLEVAEVDDALYAVTSRNIDGSTTYFLEKFDAARYTDCGVYQTGAAASTWSGHSHLNGESVKVRGDGLTLNDATVSGGIVATTLDGSTWSPTAVEAGLGFAVTVEPTPPQQGEFTSISKVTLDLFESRAVFVNGFRVRDYLPGVAITDAPSPLSTGFRAMPVRGWGDRQTVTITQTEPQPLTLRALDIEVA